MPRASKGSEFERNLCKQLSAWWTNGERDDIYWRSSQSGGRATQRSKKGKTTFGSYGDIAFVDPLGKPLLDMFTIELKRGSSYSSPGDLIDFKKDNSSHPWIKCVLQAIRSAKQAKSQGWLMICKRDHRQIIVYGEIQMFRSLSAFCQEKLTKSPSFTLKIPVSSKGHIVTRLNIAGIPLDSFFARVKPQEIINCLRSLQ